MLDNDNGIKKVIPDHLINELVQWRDEMTHSYWRVGDIANEVWALAVANDLDLTKMQAYARVAQVVGKSARSVRLYATASGFYPPEVREQYGILPYSHFVFAMQFRGDNPGGMQIWQSVLERAVDMTTEYGIPPSVDQLGLIYRDELGKQREQYPEPQAVFPQELGGLPDYGGAGTAPEYRLKTVYNEMALVTNRAIQALAVLDELDKMLDLGETVRFYVAQAVAANRQLMTEVEGMVKDARTLYAGSYTEVQDPVS